MGALNNDLNKNFKLDQSHDWLLFWVSYLIILFSNRIIKIEIWIHNQPEENFWIVIFL